ncbi:MULTISPECIES: carboxypeptidase M32 [Methylobacterium]|jgi:carboxypeptidase Taq|uniref:carboxypeptidase M32 n=1 Tax=Methylobacterium TaxID=407 RepID=UPI0008EDD25E|nr:MULTISPECIES: carboxypeptidase M32 [Methylobacterium]MBZ6412070.1 carboxypeptidase M32 [Methylobacterium sp.]MBK3395850.1 carboxypeptidase M32 [Methylobacterium ajmalii]MBK3412157.1 carboxypeptidase M32 [Methylobacterium ajmalii]MBK3423962.1 carboxypeptidase M32 [Methylobacterium ajmalii]SFF13143.1 carboxypeptidase Taq [Methylobacterium sp. yr596]
MQAYRALEATFARIGALEDASGILGWDAQTLMPDGAAEGRGDQIAVLRGLAHDLLTDPATADRLAAAEEEGGLDDWSQANLTEMRRAHTHAAAVPRDLVEAGSRAVSRAEMTWREARRASDFALLRPDLAEVLALQREIGRAKGEALGLSPYDALLDSYDPGLRQAAIDPVFAVLEAELPGLIAEAQDRQAAAGPAPVPQGPFPVEAQRQVGLALMRAAGFDFRRGRLDVSLHPFCGGATDDVRITTRYDEADFARALMGVLHETGHALYEQGRPAAWRRQPVGAARGMSLHESQSLTLEMQAGRSREFVAYLAPLVREAFGGTGPAWEADALHRNYTRVVPGFIRVDADECTYPAHILLRYRLERALIRGEMEIGDLPGAFDEGLHRLLGLTVPDDAHGCLQDIHWPGGAWGYFPTYTLGAMMAAQLFDAACTAEPDLRPGLARGDFAPLVGWLRTHVHAKGSAAGTQEILAAATGRPLDAGVFLDHLRRRYLDA